MIDNVVLARLLIPVFTFVIGVIFQYIIFYEQGMSFFSLLLTAPLMWIIYLFLGMLSSEHLLRFMKKRK